MEVMSTCASWTAIESSIVLITELSVQVSLSLGISPNGQLGLKFTDKSVVPSSAVRIRLHQGFAIGSIISSYSELFPSWTPAILPDFADDNKLGERICQTKCKSYAPAQQTPH